MKNALISALVLMSYFAKAQDSTKSPKINFSAYSELYYGYDFNKPSDHRRLPFLYTYNRHNELNLNLGLVKGHYETENMRANLALIAGTYVQDNMVAEEEALKYINEANIGFKISKSKNLWIDAGILPSHIGWESAIGKDNLTLLRSIAAENSPYFETGAKLSYTSDNGKWFLSGMLLNGWQRIAKASHNQSLSFGHQMTYSPSDKLSVNSSSYIGNDFPTEEKKVRYFHNLYAIIKPTSDVTTIVGFDIGAQQKEKGSNQYYSWYSPNLLAKYQFNNKTGIGGRIEYYHDPANVIISTEQTDPFKTLGYSINIDHSIQPNLLFRIEARNLHSSSPIFMKDTSFEEDNLTLMSSLSAWF